MTSIQSSASSQMLFLVVVIFFATGTFLWSRIDSDKTPYILELHHGKVKYLEAQMRAILNEQTGTTRLDLRSSQAKPKHYYLNRWPIRDEVFVGYGKQNLVIGREDEDTLWIRPLASMDHLLSAKEGTFRAVTGAGIVIASNAIEKEKKDGPLVRQLIDDFFRNGFSVMTRIEKSGNLGNRVVAHREIEDTNIILIVESKWIPDEHFSSESENRKYLKLLFAVIATIAIGYYLIRLTISPLRSLVKDATAAASGRFFLVKPFGYGDEVSHIQSVLHEVKVRAKNSIDLKLMTKKQRSELYWFINHASAATTFESVLNAMSSILAHHSTFLFLKSNVFAFFLPVTWVNSKGISTYKTQLILNGQQSHQAKSSWINLSPELEIELRDNLRKKDSFSLNDGSLVYTLRFDRIVFGFIHIQQNSDQQIPHHVKHWILVMCRIAGMSLWRLPAAGSDSLES